MRVKARCFAVGILIALCLAAPLSPRAPGAKPATLLPALVWNPHNLPSGDSLYQSLIRANYEATLTWDLAPFLDSLSNYHLFIMAGIHEYGEPILTYPEFQPFIAAFLSFLDGGGSAYWEGTYAFSDIVEFCECPIMYHFPHVLFMTMVPDSPYLVGIDSTLFADIDSLGYEAGGGATYALTSDWIEGSLPALDSPPLGGYCKATIFQQGQMHTMLSGFSWGRLNDSGLDTREDLIRDVMNWLSGTTAAVESEPLPTEFALSQNYPNPFNAQTTIEYALPEAGNVRLHIYDIGGRAVATLIDGEMPAGYHRAIWEAKGMPSGLYFMRLSAGEFVETRKMTLLK